MGNKIVLNPSRGTKLYRNQENPLHILVSTKNYVKPCLSLLIDGNFIGFLKLDSQNFPITISPRNEFLLVNLSDVPFSLELDHNPKELECLFDPYLYEKKPFEIINPADFISTHSVSRGYIDVLAKWYSIKFTYPDKNLIHIRPHMGISIQSHTKRNEDWEIIKGHPIIIANSEMHYSVKPNDHFHVNKGELHGIFNPTDEWVVIKEKYSGEFEEDDIIRVFNPNHYY
jgi:mannose-6-phosphate isomerase-like protein (cupin superfamily)